MTSARRQARSVRGRKAHLLGHMAEHIALMLLMLKGYHIIGFRLETPYAEVDIIACRGQRLALIEVKHRRDLITALEAVGSDQQACLWQAGEWLQSRYKALACFSLNLDLSVFAPRCWPKHYRNALHGV